MASPLLFLFISRYCDMNLNEAMKCHKHKLVYSKFVRREVA